MLFYKKNNLYRLFFFLFFIFKKKKLGYKKVQWRLSSFFHMNRMKYFFYFLKKLFMYKKYFFYFFLKHNLSYLCARVTYFFNTLCLRKTMLLNSSYIPTILGGSIFQHNLNVINVNNLTNNTNSIFSLFFSLYSLKLFFIMFKSLKVSYFALPIKRNKFTILRSPHIDKKSREQFELKHFNIVLNELSMFSLTNNNFLNNQFKFFISNFKLDEKNEFLIK